MPKFFTEKENIFDGKVYITGEDVEHLSRVYRAKPGYELTVCDGCGTDYSCRITDMEKTRITAEILSFCKSETEPKVKVTLFQGLPKQGKMETVIQKTTELGISEIVPCELSRCVVKLEGNKKTQRWQKISEEAAKQSGRGIIPEVHDPVNLKQAIEMMREDNANPDSYIERMIHKELDVDLCEVTTSKLPVDWSI